MKKTLFLALIVLLHLIQLEATPARLDGFYGRVFVPDYEFDTLRINPAFVLDLAGLEIYDNNYFNLKSQTSKKNNYEDAGVVVPPYGMIRTNISSSEETSDSESLISPELGILGTLYKNIGAGLLINPDVQNAKSTRTTAANAVSPTQKEEYEATSNDQSVLNVRGIFGFGLEILSLGAKVGYDANSTESKETMKTNGVVDLAQSGKSESSTGNFIFGAGGLFNVLQMKIGLYFELGSTSGTEKPSWGYDPVRDIFWAENEISDSSFGFNLIIEKELSKENKLRIVSLNDFGSSEKKSTIDRVNYETVYGAGTYDAVRDGQDNTEESDSDINVYASLVNSFGINRLKFAGLHFNYFKDESTRSVDNNIAAAATTLGQQYTIKEESSRFTVSAACGLEGDVAADLILRAGLSTDLFSVASSKYTLTDGWNYRTSAAGDTVYRDYSDSATTILTSITLTGGASYGILKNLVLDMSATTVLGLNSVSSKSDGTKTEYPGSFTKDTEDSSTQFVLECAATYKF